MEADKLLTLIKKLLENGYDCQIGVIDEDMGTYGDYFAVIDENRDVVVSKCVYVYDMYDGIEDFSDFDCEHVYDENQYKITIFKV